MSSGRRRLLRLVGFLGVVGLVVLYAAGAFHRGRIAPGRTGEPPGLPAPVGTARAERVTVPVIEEAVGTVRSRQRVAVAAQITARVLLVHATVGDSVRRGAPLILLDDSDFAAAYARATAQYERIRGFFARQAATAEQLEAAEAEYRQAKATIEHVRISSPIDGVVAERQVEPGDLAIAGRPLLVVLDPRALRLEAQIREGLIGYVRPGTHLDVVLPAVPLTLTGTVAEVLPAADPQSRTFEVRVNLEPSAGVYPGMFGRLRLPVGERQVVAVPSVAVARAGQLETVVVRSETGWVRRLVTTGAVLPDGSVEVLSGLAGGETIGVPASS